MELGYGWFLLPPAHPDMKEFDNDLAFRAVPIALEATLAQFEKPRQLDSYEKLLLGVNNAKDFNPKDNGSGKRTREEFFDYIKQMLDDGIKPVKGYAQGVYVIDNFPFASGRLNIEDYLRGSGRVYLTKDRRWYGDMPDEIFRTIPEETLSEFLKEFKIKHTFSPKLDTPHSFRQNAEDISGSWYIKDAYNEKKIFAQNFITAYTNIFLRELGK
jgi:hypothetical protein